MPESTNVPLNEVQEKVLYHIQNQKLDPALDKIEFGWSDYDELKPLTDQQIFDSLLFLKSNGKITLDFKFRAEPREIAYVALTDEERNTNSYKHWKETTKQPPP